MQSGAGYMQYSSKLPEHAALQIHIAMKRAATLVGNHIDDTAYRIRSIERRTGALHNFDTAGVRKPKVAYERTGIGLGCGNVAQLHAINENGGIVSTQAAHLDRGIRAGPAGLHHAHSG